MPIAYLDNSATTQVSPAAAEKAAYLMRECFGNPASVHGLGIAAESELSMARRQVAEALGAEPCELYFTAGGTEANNLAVLGGALAARRAGNKIVTSAVEHPSVLQAVRELASHGFETVVLPVDGCGRIRLSDLEQAVDEHTVLVSVMLVNNEVGTVQPVSAIREIIRSKHSPALLHADCVQAFGKLPVKASALGTDLLTVSAHKIHGPKGVGALYVKKGTKLLPQTVGGGQEKGLRSGTEAMPLIGAFAVAVSEIPPLEQAARQAASLRDALLQGVAPVTEAVVNSPADGSPYVINLSMPGIPSEVMIRALEAEGVYVSGGSACAKGARSHVLTAMGLPPRVIDSALRVSFSHHTTLGEIEQFTAAFQKACGQLRRKRV